ncbi:MAG: DUF4097 family beta strand repeat-containing protein [Pseudomonadota bacterium]
MKRRMSHLARALIAVALVGAPGVVAAKTVKQSLPTQGVDRVEVKLRSGHLTVRPGGATTLEVESDQPGLQVDTKDGLIRIDDKKLPEGTEVELHLALPAKLQLKAVIVSGRVDVEGVPDKVELKMIDGDTHIRRCGTLRVKAVSGEIEVAEASGDVELETVSGGVRLVGMSGERLKIKTVSGDIRAQAVDARDIELHAFSGDVRFEGSLRPGAELEVGVFSGDVLLRLPATQSFEFEAKSRDGRVQLQGPLQVFERSEHHARAKAGAGGPEIRVKSFSSDIRVEVGESK